MASIPANTPEQTLPLFYKSVVPLSSQFHPNHGLKQRDNLAFTRKTHAIPITVDEFVIAQRHYPIVFGLGENPAPLALVGLEEGNNLYLGADDQWEAGQYVPAFVRRYPFMLARLSPTSEELSLCFDDSSDQIVADEGDRLFDGTDASETTKNILTFCEQFEQAVFRTRSFMEELTKLDLLMDGEVTIQRPGVADPAIYRGFRMVAEDKLQGLRGDQSRKMVQSGMMGLVYAHLFSLSLISGLFEKQVAATTVPG
ncbi:peptidase [Polymorphobacter glacialis]|uniref:Peptidase n=1 Tax=Sandarakinorhabdus glacialis TaxID=1614636 RepID=A0A917E7G5_9SPHN|nr:SapC family protein [Polymorphobacter glacialis]GGE12394.1 peptidase [Polymorphobacter glacialis]